MLMKRLIKNKLHFKLESCKSPLNHFQFYTFQVQKNGSVDNIPFPKLKLFLFLIVLFTPNKEVVSCSGSSFRS